MRNEWSKPITEREYDRVLGHLISLARDSLFRTQEGVAKTVGLSRTKISDIENGSGLTGTWWKTRSLCIALDLRVDELFAAVESEEAYLTLVRKLRLRRQELARGRKSL